jgi:type I restriction enzyme S subunit
MDFEGPADWPAVSLSELGEVNRGRSRHRPRHADHLYGGPYPFIQTGDIKSSGGRISSYSQTYSEAGLAQSRLWPTGTMCITIAANIAETAVLGFPACFPDSVVGFIADPSKSDVQFVEFMFRQMRRTIQHQATGSVQDNINLETLGRLRFPLPPLPEQKRIAHILGTLDDKIELNRRMNATLEAMSRAIFKSWFVDFDPVRQKAAGKQPLGMDAQTASLFPDSFEDSEIGEVPKGWPVSVVGDLYDITMGQSPPGDTYNESGDGIPFFQGRADFSFRYPKKRVFCTDPTRFAAPGDTLVSVRAPVGDLNMALEPCAIGRGVAAVRHKTGAAGFTYYGMHALSSHFEKFEGEGTVFGSMGKKEFHGIRTVSPAEGVINAFEIVVSPPNKQIENLERQAASLAALRDTLLPKLLSGEVRVPDAEVMVEGAVG